MNQHEAEERDFGQGPRLWDAGEGVCCAAFQLGACSHTETPADDEHAYIGDVYGDEAEEAGYVGGIYGDNEAGR